MIPTGLVVLVLLVQFHAVCKLVVVLKVVVVKLCTVYTVSTKKL